jgi:hypothetical protein
LVERRPELTIAGNPLPFIGANRAHTRCGGVLDTAGSAQPEHGHNSNSPGLHYEAYDEPIGCFPRAH